MAFTGSPGASQEQRPGWQCGGLPEVAGQRKRAIMETLTFSFLLRRPLSPKLGCTGNQYLSGARQKKKRSLRSLFCLSLPRSAPPLATSSLFVSVLLSLTQIHTISISLSVFPSSPSLLFLSQPSRLAFIKVLSPLDRPDGVFLPIKGPANNKQV